jgi:hypothetical protein
MLIHTLLVDKLIEQSDGDVLGYALLHPNSNFGFRLCLVQLLHFAHQNQS